MTLYEIDDQIWNLLETAVDPETGEFLPDASAQLEALQMERDRKVENLACAVKNYRAEAAAIKAEEDALEKRRKAVEAKAERAKSFLNYALAGEKFKSAKVSVSYRTFPAVELDDSFMQTAPDEFIRRRDPEPNKVAIMAALRAGEKIQGATLVERTSTLIK